MKGMTGIDAIESKDADTREEMVVKGKSMAEIVTEAVHRQTEEEKKIESRKNNIILDRVPELNVADAGQHRERDESFIAELCKEVLGIELSEGDVRAVIRLGKRRDDGMSRPLLVKTKNPWPMLRNWHVQKIASGGLVLHMI